MWESESCRKLMLLDGHLRSVRCCAYDSTGTYLPALLLSRWPKHPRCACLAARPSKRPRLAAESVVCAFVAPAGSAIVSGSGDFTCKLWSVANESMSYVFQLEDQLRITTEALQKTEHQLREATLGRQRMETLLREEREMLETQLTQVRMHLQRSQVHSCRCPLSKAPCTALLSSSHRFVGLPVRSAAQLARAFLQRTLGSSATGARRAVACGAADEGGDARAQAASCRARGAEAPI